RATATGLGRLERDDLAAGLGQPHRGREPGQAASDHDGPWVAHRSAQGTRADGLARTAELGADHRSRGPTRRPLSSTREPDLELEPDQRNAVSFTFGPELAGHDPVFAGLGQLEDPPDVRG